MSLNLDSYPCEYINTDLEEKKQCKLKLPYMDPGCLPKVSILTPTYCRKIFLPLMLRNWKNIDYPQDKLEWIILDDSPEDKGLKAEMFKGDKRIKFIHIKNKVPLGKKRNLLCQYANNPILVHMDDDDFYPKTSVLSRVKVLILSKGKNCVGCTTTLCYDLLMDKTFEAFDPSPKDDLPSTISESSLAYTKKFWLEQKYINTTKNAECLDIIKNRHDQIITLPYIFVVTQFSHSNNTIQRKVITQSIQFTNNFTDNISISDSMLIIDLRKNIIMKFPNSQYIINLIKRYPKIKDFIKNMEKNESQEIKNHILTKEYIRSTHDVEEVLEKKEIIYFCSPGKYMNYPNPWNGKTKGLGGSEESVKNISEYFVKQGYKVKVYCTTKKEIKHNGVIYIPDWKWQPLKPTFITIIWRDPSHLDISINSQKIYLDLHDVIHSSWITPKRRSNLNGIFCKSQFQAQLLPKRIKTNVFVIPNPIKIDIQKQFTTNFKSNNIVSTSSPDRCIEGLLDLCDELTLNNLKDIKVYWAYGWSDSLINSNNKNIREWVINIKNRIKKTSNFKELGRLNHNEIEKLLYTNKIYAYGTNFPEIDCISLTKAMAAGCIPIVSNNSVLGEKVSKYSPNIKLIEHSEVYTIKKDDDIINFSFNSNQTHFKQWVNMIIEYLNNPIPENIIEKQRKEIENNFSIKIIGDKWISCIC